MTQEDLAELLGLDRKKGRSRVANWEQDYRYPGFDLIRKICRIFEVSSDEMLGLANSSEVEVDGARQKDKVSA